jgi:hypothetical protein
MKSGKTTKNPIKIKPNNLKAPGLPPSMKKRAKKPAKVRVVNSITK